jgi:hypothetical protein
VDEEGEEDTEQKCRRLRPKNEQDKAEERDSKEYQEQKIMTKMCLCHLNLCDTQRTDAHERRSSLHESREIQDATDLGT